MKRTYFKLTAVSAAVMAAMGVAYVINAAPVVELTLGETISVTGVAVADGVPEECTEVGDAVTCPNLRSAIQRANTNNDPTTTYDKIVLENGSVHTLDEPRALTELIQAGEVPIALEAFDNAGGDLDITGPVNIETVDPLGDKATIQGAEGFNDRLLHVNAKVGLTNLVLTKGQALYMNGGAIYAEGAANTTITRSEIRDNFAKWNEADETKESQGSGGGIYSKGPLRISMSTLSMNIAKTLRGLGTDEGDKVGNGGAIYASQATTIEDSTIGGLDAGNEAISGGAIQMAGGNPLVIDLSTLSHNKAVGGGAINIVSPGTVMKGTNSIVNSTISTNRVTDMGAGINTNASIDLLNTTIADNVQESSGAQGKGSGVNRVSIEAVITMQNTLLSNNLRNVLDVSESANCGKSGEDAFALDVTSVGNLSTDSSCNFPSATDIVVTDAKIGPLELNGNTRNGNFTHALLTGSLAIDKGTSLNCPATDERGVVRPQAGLVRDVKVCDVGAFELVVDFPAPSDDDGGCTIGSNNRFDPLFPALVAMGLGYFGLRRFKASK